jgi:hypothetical protein
MEQNGLSDIEGKAAMEAVSEVGAERVSKQRSHWIIFVNFVSFC